MILIYKDKNKLSLNNFYLRKMYKGNTIRSVGYNLKTDRNFIIIDDQKIKINKLINSSYKNYKMKKYKTDYEIENETEY